MTIVLTGGGSGGHITPILAVAHELKKANPKINLIYIGQTGDKLGDIPAHDPNIDEIFTVRAGKFRRYHGQGFAQLLDVKTFILNVRDGFLALAGLWQSWRLLRRLQPDVIFVKGGFVGVPVGLAAARLKIPFITHDSDIIPGLANRIIGRWAKMHAVALPADLYAYPIDKTVTVGVPLAADFIPVTNEVKSRYRADLTVPVSARVLFIIGGGLGAQSVNRAVGSVMAHLLDEFKDLYVFHSAGRANETEMRQFYNSEIDVAYRSRIKVFGFLSDVYRYSGAADVVVTRAGATNLAELAVQGKACLVIPAAHLTGGQQLKNAQYLEDEGAIRVLQQADLEQDPNRLAKQVSELLKDTKLQRTLGSRFEEFSKSDASSELAVLLLDQAKNTKKHSNEITQEEKI